MHVFNNSICHVVNYKRLGQNYVTRILFGPHNSQTCVTVHWPWPLTFDLVKATLGKILLPHSPSIKNSLARQLRELSDVNTLSTLINFLFNFIFEVLKNLFYCTVISHRPLCKNKWCLLFRTLLIIRRYLKTKCQYKTILTLDDLSKEHYS